MLKRIRVQQLVLGMHIDGFCAPWMDHPFWRNHFVLNDPKDIERILASSVQEIWIDTSKGLDVPPGVEPLAQTTSAEAIAHEILQAEAPARDIAPTTAAEEYARASRICVKSKQAVMAMFDAARMGEAVDTELAAHMVQEISDSVLRNPDAMISLARLKTADNYTYMHSVAVCALMVSLALQLQLDPEQTKIAGMGGLLHDLGKAMTPTEVLNKPAKLTDAEFTIIKAHPVQGYDMLVNDPGLDKMVLDIVLHHHEKTDGTGYPDGLAGEAISMFARMGAICDVYDAITSDRPYKKGWDPSEAMRKMAGWTTGHLDAKVFQSFVKSVGIYPTGSLVRLASGRIGVVTAQNPRALLKPVVKAFFSTKSDMRIPPVLVNLAAPDSKEKIIAREDPQVWKFPDLNPLWSGFEPSSW
ncbi:HD-GYP domain-containing protein [Rhodoferax sp.]|uniref:HD-GYP domain-containing protein n=1 Tax=Rhodoferax sp. TaxID=50421 RepID=UPI00374CBABC